MRKPLLIVCCVFFFGGTVAVAQQSVARQWNEVMLQAIRLDFARPPVNARNLYHVSMAMYDAWAVYDSVAEPFFLGHTIGNYTCQFDGVPPPADVKAAQEEALSYAVYRLLVFRYNNSPHAYLSAVSFDSLMQVLGYDPNYLGFDYQNGSPAALGNYIAKSILEMGFNDGSSELGDYGNSYYNPVNPPLVVSDTGNLSLLDPNRWQPLALGVALDQNGNPVPSVQPFLGAEWGNVQPFAMTAANLNVYQRYGQDYKVYYDPGPLPKIDTVDGGGDTDEYRWNFELVAKWSAHIGLEDSVLIDISPAAIGNLQSYPQTLAEYHDFYDYENGGDHSTGRPLNPKTGLPYAPQIVPRGDYTRILSQFWADGPNSETPPGHWYTIMNFVSDAPGFEKRFNGKGPIMDNLEWDIKAYFCLGGALHDAAIAAWGIKGWYDGIRPISAIRYMADRGQRSDPNLPNFDPAGLTLQPGFCEIIEAGDSLAGPNNEYVGEIKLKVYRGPETVTDPETQVAGVGWILAKNWWPYQHRTFVTPPFGGYISGHSCFSRAAAEALTLLTGDEYFPGGMGEFYVQANAGFLRLEQGPSVDVTLQWATYRDASDQTSLSRIWGGIHPPFDDIPGRMIGMQIGPAAYILAKSYYYPDLDHDGFVSIDDCDDTNPNVNPGAVEVCDGLDNDCNGQVDDLPIFTYYADLDGDGFGGDLLPALDTCLSAAPVGYVSNQLDCNDNDASISPAVVETCDGIDNDCNGLVDDNIVTYTYFPDFDGDGYGNDAEPLDTCLSTAPSGYVVLGSDCNDQDASIMPGAAEICDGIDNDCNGIADDLPFYIYFQDADGDGYGNASSMIDTCLVTAPAGYTYNDTDCDDNNAAVYPGATEIVDGLDNDCNGLIDDVSATNEASLVSRYYPNPVHDYLFIESPFGGAHLNFEVRNSIGQLEDVQYALSASSALKFDFTNQASGLYLIRIYDVNTGKQFAISILKVE